jgi:hypothetical protein
MSDPLSPLNQAVAQIEVDMQGQGGYGTQALVNMVQDQVNVCETLIPIIEAYIAGNASDANGPVLLAAYNVTLSQGQALLGILKWTKPTTEAVVTASVVEPAGQTQVLLADITGAVIQVTWNGVTGQGDVVHTGVDPTGGQIWTNEHSTGDYIIVRGCTSLTINGNLQAAA